MGGFPMPVHHCGPRSEIATLFATVFTQPDGMPPIAWHHQIMIETAQPVAIRFCPFCGVELDLQHFANEEKQRG